MFIIFLYFHGLLHAWKRPEIIFCGIGITLNGVLNFSSGWKVTAEILAMQYRHVLHKSYQICFRNNYGYVSQKDDILQYDSAASGLQREFSHLPNVDVDFFDLTGIWNIVLFRTTSVHSIGIKYFQAFVPWTI